MIRRELSIKLQILATQFPAVAVLGPRQSGKTTLVQSVFPEYLYFSFEDPDVRALIQEDPRGFLNKYKDERGIILDEVQHVPFLFSYMQTHIDATKKIGHFIVTGSQNLLVNESITQSLAGRIALLTLLPLSIQELTRSQQLTADIDDALFKGCYPALYTSALPAPLDWYRSYINTYLERDVRQIKNITDLSIFQKFMKLCAGRIGRLIDLTSLSNDTGMSVHAIKQWLSVLEASYIIFFLQPYYRNLGKRVIKSPKLYFYDTGIACSLLSITEPGQLFTHYLRGSLFESYIIADLFKQRLNAGLNVDCYFWQDHTGHEVDCIIEHGQKLIPLEIKVGATINPDFFKNLMQWNKIADTLPENNILVYGGDSNFAGPHAQILSWRTIGHIALKG